MESSDVGRRAGQSRTQGRAEQCKQCGGQGSLCDTGTGQRRGRTELNVRRLISSAFYIHLFPLFNSAEKRVFFWDAVIENLPGLRSNGGGLRLKMRRSQCVKISPALWTILCCVVIVICFE